MLQRLAAALALQVINVQQAPVAKPNNNNNQHTTQRRVHSLNAVDALTLCRTLTTGCRACVVARSCSRLGNTPKGYQQQSQQSVGPGPAAVRGGLVLT